ncbi:hypothetical protein HY450_02120 [Candidatus Pacearchaeota archaeon]|nr:hypothetical protein [Candidatus Pacearchaeota archaeon]
MASDLRKINFLLLIFLLIFNSLIVYSDFTGGDACIVNSEGNSSCSTVQNSEYGEILGFKVAWIGLLGFAVLIFFYYMSGEKNKDRKFYYKIFLFLTFAGVLFSLYFIFVQFFILRDYCYNCLIIDGTMLVFAVLVFAEWKYI